MQFNCVKCCVRLDGKHATLSTLREMGEAGAGEEALRIMTRRSELRHRILFCQRDNRPDAFAQLPLDRTLEPSASFFRVENGARMTTPINSLEVPKVHVRDAEYGRRAEIARMLGVHRQQITNWLDGWKTPTLEQGLRLQAFLKKRRRSRG
jgi:hypothetical protein